MANSNKKSNWWDGLIVKVSNIVLMQKACRNIDNTIIFMPLQTFKCEWSLVITLCLKMSMYAYVRFYEFSKLRSGVHGEYAYLIEDYLM